MPSRNEERKGMDTSTRLTLLEHDADDMQEAAELINRKLTQVLVLVVGTALTTGTAAVMLAANLVISGGSP